MNTTQNPQPLTYESVLSLIERSTIEFNKKLEAERVAREAERAEFEAEYAKRAAEFEAKRKADYARRAEEDARSKAEADARGADLDRRLKELSINIGGIQNKMGKMAEHIIGGSFYTRFAEPFGIHFNGLCRNREFTDAKLKCVAEADILLINNDYEMAIEVKMQPTKDDIDEHIERLQTIIENTPMYKNGEKRLLGALAGVIFHANMQSYATKNGLFVLVQNGDNIDIIPPKEFEIK
ncbi:MAG: hypothetical protein LBO69_08260 [Ignavibacteria bacterium]|jgi:hypothetical protein|nr:hypothetical protein [Ignavibacteria bacterium]